MEFYAILLLLLFAGHALADYPLQGEFVSIYKNRHLEHPFIKQVIWGWLLYAHVLIHSLFVLIFTGNIWLALIELAIHTGIDYGKCEKSFGFHIDQSLHYLCKLAYVALIYFGIFHWYNWPKILIMSMPTSI